MQWIILIGNEKFGVKSIKTIEHIDSIRYHNVSEDEFQVEYNNDWIIYQSANDVLADYEDDELEKLNKLPFTNLNFVKMRYKSKKRMREILKHENFLRGIYIDNDHWLIVPIEEFIRLGMPVGAE